MEISDQKIEELALEKYPNDSCLLGSCAGVRQTDKNAFERKIWIEGFKDALKYLNEDKE